MEDDQQSYTRADEEVDPDYASIPREADELDEEDEDANPPDLLDDLSAGDITTSQLDDLEGSNEQQEEALATGDTTEPSSSESPST